MPYQRVDLTVDENADFVLSPAWIWLSAAGSPIDLTGYTASMMVRKAIADTTPLLTLSSGSGITLGATAGTIVVSITQAQVNALVASLTAAGARLAAFYDLLLTSSGAVHTRFSEGMLAIDRAATR